MALSMDEQRILDQIERGLATADPGLATRMAAFGSSGGTFAGRMRRLRLLASFSTLLVVAVVSLVVYAVMPFRSPAERHAGSKASAAPPQPVMMAPSHAAGRPAAPVSAAPVSAAPVSSAPVSSAPVSAGPLGPAPSGRAKARPSAPAGRPASPAKHATRPQ